MSIAGVENGLLIFGVYCAIGLVFGLLFVFFGVGRADAAAKGSSWLFRLAILPGVILLWPIVLGRFLSGYQVNKDIHASDNGEDA
jgi:uncharacterized membrane protein